MTQDDQYYIHPVEVWDKKTCKAKANHVATDGLGTKYPFKGYIGSGTDVYFPYGKTTFNGGCVREGKWYQGEIRPLPQVASGFVIKRVPSWGYQLVEEKNE